MMHLTVESTLLICYHLTAFLSNQIDHNLDSLFRGNDDSD